MYQSSIGGTLSTNYLTLLNKLHLVSFISNVYKQRFLQLVWVSENLSNGLVFSRKF